ncbi:hypothetical protein BU17DRAFT_88466 [Hysterangium stoloniferum]|nr:hypothetical protein BU17DRAFT_88466 [Hysterangium stoloniferum]
MAPKKLTTTLTKKKSAQEALSRLQATTEEAVQAAAAQGRPTGEYVMEATNVLARQRKEFSAAEADFQKSNNPLKRITHKTSKLFDKIVDVSEHESGRVMTLSQEDMTKCECSVRKHVIKVVSNQKDTLQGKSIHRTGRQKVIKDMTSLFVRLIRLVYIQQRPRVPKWTNLTDASAEEKKKREEKQRQVYAKSLDTAKIEEIEEKEKEKEREREREATKRDSSNLPGTSKRILHFNTVDRINAMDIERERLLALPPPPPRHATMAPMKGDTETVPSEDYINRWSIDYPSEESVGHGSMHSMVSNASSRTAGSGVSKLSHHDAGSILRGRECPFAPQPPSTIHAPISPSQNPSNQFEEPMPIFPPPRSSSLRDPYWEQPVVRAAQYQSSQGDSSVTRNTTDASSNIATATALSPPPRRRHGPNPRTTTTNATSSSAFAYAAQQTPPAPPVPPKPRYQGQEMIATSGPSSSASDASHYPALFAHHSSGGSQTMSTGPASSSGLYSPSSGGPPFSQPSWSSSASAYAAHHPPPAPPVPPKPRYQGQAMIATSGQSSSASDAYHHPTLPAHNSSGTYHSITTGPASSSGLYYSSSGAPPFTQPAWSSSASAYAAHQPPPAPPVPPKPRYHGQATIATSAQSSSASDAYRHPILSAHSSSIVSQSMSTGPASSSGLYSSSSGAAPFAQPPWVTSPQGNPTRGNSSAQSSQSFSQQHKYKPQSLPPNSHPETEEERKRRKRREQTNPTN